MALVSKRQLVINLIRPIATLAVVLVVCVFPSSRALALTTKDLQEIKKHPYYSESDLEDAGMQIRNTGSNSCTSITIPEITDALVVADAINAYLQNKALGTFAGLGLNFVAGGQRSGINPFLAVAHLEHESNFGTAKGRGWHNDTYATPEAARAEDQTRRLPSYNGFGRSAGKAGMPTVYYHRTNPDQIRNVYQWTSWRASIDGAASGEEDWYAFIKRVYIEDFKLDPGDLPAYIHRYAPNSDGNNESAYVNYIRSTMSTLASMAGDGVKCQ